MRGALEGALLVLFLAGTSAVAQNRNFDMENLTTRDITGVWLSTVGDNTWHHMDNSNLPSGKRTRVSFYNVGPCSMQLKIRFDNGESPEWTDPFNFCQVVNITIWYDGHDYHARYQ